MKNGLPYRNRGRGSDSNQIVVAFEAFHQLSQVSIRPTTAISPMSSMLEDISTRAEQKRAAVIVLPFHKFLRLDGHLETTRAGLRHVNRRVLEHAPCSVGILVDRGLGGRSHVSASNVNYMITAIFFGGDDDPEALSYGALMADHPGISFNIVHFIVDTQIVGDSIQVAINYHHGPEARSEDAVFRCNLFLVGRMPEGQLVAALDKNSDCPELGPVGNLLISPEFSTNASVLVVQQYRSQLKGDSLNSLKGEEG